MRDNQPLLWIGPRRVLLGYTPVSPLVPLFDVRPNVALRPPTVADAPTLFALVDGNRGHLRAWLPWLDGCRSEADQAAFLAGVVERGQSGRGAVWLIEASGSVCGICGFNWIEPFNRVCEVGYWLSASHQGRGIVTACVGRIVRHAFDDLGLNRITIPVAIGNRRSRAIPERLGFQAEGVLRQAEWLYDWFVDHVLYARIKSDPSPQQGAT